MNKSSDQVSNVCMNIQKARQNKRWTQKQLAIMTDLTFNTISDYENGKIIPNKQDLIKIELVLGVKLSV